MAVWNLSEASFISGEVDANVADQIDSQARNLGLYQLENMYVRPQGGLRTRPGTIVLDVLTGAAGFTRIAPDSLGIPQGGGAPFDPATGTLADLAGLVQAPGPFEYSASREGYPLDFGALRFATSRHVLLHVRLPAPGFQRRFDAATFQWRMTLPPSSAEEPEDVTLSLYGFFVPAAGGAGRWEKFEGDYDLSDAQAGVPVRHAFTMPQRLVDARGEPTGSVRDLVLAHDAMPAGRQGADRGSIVFFGFDLQTANPPGVRSPRETVAMKQVSFSQNLNSLLVFLANRVWIWDIATEIATGDFEFTGARASFPLEPAAETEQNWTDQILAEATFATHLDTLFVFHPRFWPWQAIQWRDGRTLNNGWAQMGWRITPPNAQDAIGAGDTSGPTLSSEAGGPACGRVFKGRLIVAGSPRYPNGVWFSALNELTNFNPITGQATDDAGAGFVFLTGETINTLQHLAAADRLFLMGNLQIDFVNAVAVSREALTANGVQLGANRGVAQRVPPASLEGRVAYLPVSRNAVYALTFTRGREGYTEANLTLFNNQMCVNPSDLVYANDVRDAEGDFLLMVNRISAPIIGESADDGRVTDAQGRSFLTAEGRRRARANLAVASIDLEAGLNAWCRWTHGKSHARRPGRTERNVPEEFFYDAQTEVRDVEVVGNRIWQTTYRRGQLFLEYYHWDCPLDFANGFLRGQNLPATPEALRHPFGAWYIYWDLVVEGVTSDRRKWGKKGYGDRGEYRKHYWDLVRRADGSFVLPTTDPAPYTVYVDAQGEVVHKGRYEEIVLVDADATTGTVAVDDDGAMPVLPGDGSLDFGQRPTVPDAEYPFTLEADRPLVENERGEMVPDADWVPGWNTVARVWIGQRFSQRVESLDYVDRRPTGASVGVIRSSTKQIRVGFAEGPPGWPRNVRPTNWAKANAQYRVNGRNLKPNPTFFAEDRRDAARMQHEFTNIAGWWNRNTVRLEFSDPCILTGINRTIFTGPDQ